MCGESTAGTAEQNAKISRGAPSHRQAPTTHRAKNWLRRRGRTEGWRRVPNSVPRQTPSSMYRFCQKAPSSKTLIPTNCFVGTDEVYPQAKCPLTSPPSVNYTDNAALLFSIRLPMAVKRKGRCPFTAFSGTSGNPPARKGTDGNCRKSVTRGRSSAG